MAKKIVILNGSPRLNGNTAELIKAFTAGAEENGHTVIRFDLDRMNIHGCKGCLCGGKNPDSPCVQKDDMEKVYPEYKSCDLLVLASPMYYWGISGQLKCAIDRLFAVTESDPKGRLRSRTWFFSWPRRETRRKTMLPCWIITIPC